MPRGHQDVKAARWPLAAGVALAIAGAAIGAPSLSMIGVLVAVTAALLWVWNRECLTGVSYVRTLDQGQALFGDTVHVEIELVNDKVLPLTWLHVRDVVPPTLRVVGAPVESWGWRAAVNIVLPMLPYQQLRRRLTVVCDRRGEHRFGPAELRSGSPLGFQERSVEVFDQVTLLVYPKVTAITLGQVASRVPLGETKAVQSLAVDPMRAIGVREYRPGDPVRHVDWRATARGSGDLLLRVHEPATSLRVCVFVDLSPPARIAARRAGDVSELCVSIAASVVSLLCERGVPTGVYASGTVKGEGLARPPSSGPDALGSMLELLARVAPSSQMPIERVLLAAADRVHGGTSAIVISADFHTQTIGALAQIRRRAAVTTIWVSTGEGHQAPPEVADVRREVGYDDDWTQRSVLELAGTA